VKKVLGIAASTVPEVDEAREGDGERSEHRPDRGDFQISRRNLRIGRQAIDLRPVHEQVKRVEAAEHRFVGAVQIGAALPGVLQATDSRLRRQAAAEEKAMKAPIKMLFPTVMFIFPAMFIVLLGPAVMNILKVLG